MTQLLQMLTSWKRVRVVVFGDFMLDQMVLGDAERLTADAPVPVLHVRETRHMPGGAANVCMNLAALECVPIAVGIVGDDAEGRELRRQLEAAGTDCTGLIVDPSRPTTVKRSLVGLAQHRHPQKMFRLDYESCDPVNDAVRGRMIAALDAALAGASSAAIEDYDKGVLRGGMAEEAIERCRRVGIESIIDPAGISDFSRYAGAAAITPNRTEAERATGLVTHHEAGVDHNADLARALQKRHGIGIVVLTLDRHGALLLEEGAPPLALPTVARQVYDVTGAGDMVLSMLAAARGNGLSWPDAVRLANIAAGLEVEVFGVQPIPLDHIRREVSRSQAGGAGKLYTREDLLREVERRRAKRQRIVFTNGCFDVLHSGHVMLLEEARRQGEFLVVAINTDDKVRQFKGPSRPVNHELDRATVLSGLQAVDAVTLFAEDTPLQLIELLKPDVLVKGAEYSKAEIPGAAFVESLGGRIVQVPMRPGFSTTSTLRQMGHPAAEVTMTAETRDRFVADRPAGRGA